MIIDFARLIFKHLVVVKATLGMDVTSSILRFKVFKKKFTVFCLSYFLHFFIYRPT